MYCPDCVIPVPAMAKHRLTAYRRIIRSVVDLMRLVSITALRHTAPPIKAVKQVQMELRAGGGADAASA
jgi:hypothetical protein